MPNDVIVTPRIWVKRDHIITVHPSASFGCAPSRQAVQTVGSIYTAPVLFQLLDIYVIMGDDCAVVARTWRPCRSDTWLCLVSSQVVSTDCTFRQLFLHGDRRTKDWRYECLKEGNQGKRWSFSEENSPAKISNTGLLPPLWLVLESVRWWV